MNPRQGTYAEAHQALTSVTDQMDGDPHARKEFYWAVLQQIARTAPSVLVAAVEEVRP